MDFEQVMARAVTYREMLSSIKQETPDPSPWYPYDIMATFLHLNAVLTGEYRTLIGNSEEEPIADIGGADGDLAFFLESLGYHVDFVDHTPTNMNRLRGVRALREALHSSITITDVDLDSQFVLPHDHYRLVIFLGILYHLKNPFYALEHLAHASHYCLLSTKVARCTTDHKHDLQSLPVAYLLDAYEANNDATNFWIFSDTGLRRILNRTGWDICGYHTVGNTTDSDPATPARDERAFCLLQSRYVRSDV